MQSSKSFKRSQFSMAYLFLYRFRTWEKSIEMKTIYFLYLLLALIPLVIGQQEECSSVCDLNKCQPPEECLAGIIKVG